MTERDAAIVLIGFMCAGKTSVGRELALLKEWPLFDTDAILVGRCGQSIAEIFATRGEEEFRALESGVLTEMPSRRAIVATGGGIVLRPENVEVLRSLGTVIFLEANAETLLARVENSEPRPLLQSDDPRATLERLLGEREPLYRAAAHFTVPTAGVHPSKVAQIIVRHVG